VSGGEGAAAVAQIHDYLEDLRATRPSVALAADRSPKGRETLSAILAASQRVFERDGHAGLSLRKVASVAGVSVGNVNYYFASKRDLIEATLREALADYVEAHITQVRKGHHSPIETLLDVLDFYVSNGRRSYPLFFSMWGYAGSSDEAKALVRELYTPIGRFLFALVRAVRPDVSDNRVREIVLQLSSLEEGVKLFIGMGPDNNSALATAERHVRELARQILTTP
jgi:AcrR family transcriptional regulator